MSPTYSIRSNRTILNQFAKRKFDATNQIDLDEYRFFLENGKWKGHVCPFDVEWPYLTIPQMINEKIAEHYLFNILK